MKSFRALWVVLVLAGTGNAQTHQHGPTDSARASVRIPQLAGVPVIDGVIDSGEWDGAARLTAFRQTEPREGAPATQATEVLVARSQDQLLFAFVAHDDAMRDVRATLARRDDVDAIGDYVGLVIDPYSTRTRAFYFLFNPLGVQVDGVWSRGWDRTWDGPVSSRGRAGAHGYVVEVAIPFATLVKGRVPRAAWEASFVRLVSRTGEQSWWPALPRSGVPDLLAHTARLEGLEDIEVPGRVELIPVVTARGGEYLGPGGRMDGGVTARMRLGSGSRIEATWRPDFSFVESDVPQSSFNERWALYYPEKRPFFLENQDELSTPAVSYVSEPLRLVHTRTITRPRYGLRFLSSSGPSFAGLLFTEQETAAGTPDGRSALARFLRRADGGSQAGLLATWRERSGERSAVLAADAVLRLPTHVSVATQLAWSAARRDNAQRSALSLYLDLARDDGRSFQQLVYRRVPAGFVAALGYVPRTDLQQMVTHLGVWLRPGGAVQYVLPMWQSVDSWDAVGARAEAEYLPHVEVGLVRQTVIWVGWRSREEVYLGRAHRAARAEARITTRPWPWLRLAVSGRSGAWIRYDLDGDSLDRTFVADYREARLSADASLSRNVSVGSEFARNSFGGSSSVAPRAMWQFTARASVQFDAASSLRLIAQHDPDTGRWGASAVAARELPLGTQLHAGVERSEAELRQRTIGFIRFSRLIRW
ncbi:MAG TPA: carbohydrate binding family 9 domain-containing protein [Gemmatimonadales bacterium]|nr:carbohydrate binding family 9 domain-containing protein [Gemmatimonadales bacterium]